ncbi:pyruvate kinase [Candidatus Bathyarchaeota archaeon]|nr:pyruvate kinase [Candidatus Bathyarchaeota archaeon]
MPKKTKIVCTIGPTSLKPEVLEQMIRAGMNCARINTAYGDFDRYKTTIDTVRSVVDIPLLIDLKGPEIRLRTDKDYFMNNGEIFDVGYNNKPISFSHNFFHKMNIGDVVFIDNGKIRTSIIEKEVDSLRLLVITGGLISNGKGVNVPNKKLNVTTLSPRDLEIIDLAKKYEVEFFALSFTRNAQDVVNLKVASKGFKGAVISKIENFEGITNFDDILNASDGIMVARGDLGVEIEPERVPLIQKEFVRRCNQAGKPVVIATEMLESMIHQPNPTRAEVSDVANAILDGTDAIMLSGETAIGDFPVESVTMMNRIAIETEKATKSSVEDRGFINISDSVSWSIQRICQNMPLTKIVTLTRSGYTPRMISRFKLLVPIIAVTPSKLVKKQLELVYGVVPVYFDYLKEEDRLLSVARKLHSIKVLAVEDLILFTAAFRTVIKHSSNLIEIHTLKELLNLGE